MAENNEILNEKEGKGRDTNYENKTKLSEKIYH